MLWYDELFEYIDDKKTYSHKELVEELRDLNPDLSDSSYHWAVSSLVREGKLFRSGYDTYCQAGNISKTDYRPEYSENAQGIMKAIQEQYPFVRFTMFEMTLMNEFLNHLIARNTIYVQVEKGSSLFVFRFLQEAGYRNVMYKPSKKDFSLYWSEDCVVVTDLISEAPLRPDEPHKIMLEKMLVDIVADKLISSSFSKAELPDIFNQADNRYFLDKIRMYRYARRRNKEEQVKAYLEGE